MRFVKLRSIRQKTYLIVFVLIIHNAISLSPFYLSIKIPFSLWLLYLYLSISIKMERNVENHYELTNLHPEMVFSTES